MNNFKTLLIPLLICMSLSAIAQPMTFSNNSGDVDYTSQIAPRDMHFYLFGDGYYSKAHNPEHEFKYSTGNYTTAFYHAELYKPPPPSYEVNVGSSGNSVWTPPVVNMLPDVDTETSWQITRRWKNFMIIKFENTGSTVSNGCVDFSFDVTEMTAWADNSIIYNAWVDNIDDGIPGLITYEYSNLQPDEQRIIYLPMKSKRPAGNDIEYTVTLKENCTGPGISRTKKTPVKSHPHDPNHIAITNVAYLSNSGNLDFHYGTPIQRLNYTYYFTNDGAGPAQNVVTDLFFNLDVDLGSIEITSSEFEDAYFDYDGEGDVTFYFDDINLPGQGEWYEPSVEECRNWLSFTICLEEEIIYQECLFTQMDVYFDFEDPYISIDTTCGYSDGHFRKNPCEYEPADYIALEDDYNNAVQGLDQLFPNPAKDELSLSFSNYLNSNLEIYSISGKKVLSQNVGETLNYEVDLTGMDPGVYFVKYSTLDQQITKRFVKQ